MTKGLKQQELADATGLRQAYVSALERGLAPSTLDHVRKLAKALGVKPGLLTADLLAPNSGKELNGAA